MTELDTATEVAARFATCPVCFRENPDGGMRAYRTARGEVTYACADERGCCAASTLDIRPKCIREATRIELRAVFTAALADCGLRYREEA